MESEIGRDSESSENNIEMELSGEEVKLEENNTEVQDEEVIQKLTLEVAELKDRLLRVAAESENARRRLEKEKADSVQYASEKLLMDLMPVLDAMVSASAHTEGKDAKSLKEGLFLVEKMLIEKLERHGLAVIEALGKPFDPNLHQAIQKIESNDVEAEQVTCEYAKGYTLHGRLLRPSTVQVAVPNEPKSTD